MQSYKTDVAVLILFFNRPDHLGKVFDEVRKARPSKLFLYQDGPRGERDLPGGGVPVSAVFIPCADGGNAGVRACSGASEFDRGGLSILLRQGWQMTGTCPGAPVF